MIKVLSKIYKNQNSEYNFNKKISVYQKPDTLTEKQKIILEEAPFELNHIREYHHKYIGYCRFGGYTEMLLDLKEVLTLKNIMATDDDKKTFLAVLDIIENAEDNETFSLLVKRLSKEKCLLNSNNTSRVWFVKCLAELGILRNKYESNYSVMNKFIPYNQKFEWELDIHKNSPARADVEFPVSAWRGKLGINREIAERILTNANKV